MVNSMHKRIFRKISFPQCCGYCDYCKCSKNGKQDTRKCPVYRKYVKNKSFKIKTKNKLKGDIEI